MNAKTCRLILIVAVATFVAGAAAQPPGRGRGGPGRGMGPDASFARDRAVFHDLLQHHDAVERTVTKLQNGVRTRTTSDDTDIQAKIREHVAAMVKRMKEGRPVRRWDPVFDALFARADRVDIQVTEIDGGVEMTETSDDPDTVALIHAHAEVVSGFVANGFAEAMKPHRVPEAVERRAETRLTPEARNRVVAVSADFDRHYIPALALTNQGKARASVAAIERLQTALPGLLSRIAAPETPAEQIFDGVPEIVAIALSKAKDGETQLAHETLEPIRERLAERRRAIGIEYSLDVLSDYHVVMESIVTPAKGLDPDEADDAFVRRISQRAVEASRIWAVAEQTDFALDRPTDNWPTPKQVASNVAAVRESLVRLNMALRSGDRATILKRALGLKPPFAKLYMSFGDFTGLDAGAGEPR